MSNFQKSCKNLPQKNATDYIYSDFLINIYIKISLLITMKNGIYPCFLSPFTTEKIHTFKSSIFLKLHTNDLSWKIGIWQLSLAIYYNFNTVWNSSYFILFYLFFNIPHTFKKFAFSICNILKYIWLKYFWLKYIHKIAS